ncbi:MAG: hypothetical protein WC191_07995 [Proteiniphilum sp.]|jgi:hypothetical protein
MRTLFTLLVLFLLTGCGSQHSVVAPELDLKQAMSAFGELKAALETDNGRFWNHSLAGPLLLVNRETRTVIANESDLSGELKKHGELYLGILPVEINIANTAFEWNGKRWTMVALPLPDTRAERLNLLLHESFHRIQPALGFGDIPESQSIHLDNKDGRIFLTLELEALKKALTTDDPLPHLYHALLFRHYRYKLFPDASEAENSLELLEGLAEYTGSMLSGRDDAALRAHYATQIELFYDLDSWVRSFAYFTLPVYGYFLQQQESGWHRQVTAESDLTALITLLLGSPLLDLSDEHILTTGMAYGIEEIVIRETEREMKKRELINSYRDLFQSEGVVVLPLENMHIGFNPSNLVPLDTLGTVYPNLRITDNWGILEVVSGGALMSTAWNKVTLPPPLQVTDSLAAGEGWKLRISDGWKLEKKEHHYYITK